MIFKSLTSRVLLIASLLFSTMAMYGQGVAKGDDKAGKTLFQNNCASCHNKNMKSDLTGPALGDVETRWAAYPRTDLYKWIRNSQSMINSHPRGKELWAKWQPTVMNSFNGLSDQDIENILAYIQCMYDGSCDPAAAAAAGAVAGGGTEKPKNNTTLFILLAGILGIFAVVLARILSNLKYMLAVKEGEAAQRQSLKQILLSKSVIAFALFAAVVLGGYTTVNQAISLGRQQGYQPDQPIKFSHTTHAGVHKIDCNYCHDSARRSKHSSIPAGNTCMNCHRAIKVGSKYGTAELTKIFASVGYDPKADKYIENYENLSEDDIKSTFTAWIEDNAIQAGKSPDAAIKEGGLQWDAIKEALTDAKTGDKKIQGPIEWVRIHNLPDHVYFNHAQHVSVGKVVCQTCHGKVEEMDVLQQHAPLSMGWCINCHRQTEVKFADNGYYNSYYEKFHKELQEGKRKKVTVEDIGGLECQKCHY
jgi:cytochrome c2